MSRRFESQCINCGLHCIGLACPYYRVPVDYCEDCGDSDAKYRIDGEDLCEDCVKERLKEAFNDLTLFEQAKAVDVSLSEIND
jgi:hypothetical protein